MRRTLVVTALLALLASCAASEPVRTPRTTEGGESPVSEAPPEAPAPRPRVLIERDGASPVVVEVEVARTPAQTAHGLMYRGSLPAERGMLFVFPRAKHRSFWMVNTRIPLDMIFITPDMRVLGVVEDAEPETDDAREVEGVSQFVLEVNAGFARANEITPGAIVRFEDVGEVPAPRSDGDDGSEVEDAEDGVVIEVVE